MTTYMMLKVDFQKLSEIEIFRKSKDFGLIWTWIIIMCPWCWIWCWKQRSITVAGFQQKCCFSATNVDFPCKYCFIQAKIEKLTKKQHLLLKNNICVENEQQWCYVALYIIYSIRILLNPSKRFAQFLTHVFGRFLGDLLKKFIFHFL